MPCHRLRLLLTCGIAAGLAAARLATALAQDEGYPPGTLTPSTDLGLQSVPVDVSGKYRSLVPEDLTVNLPPNFSAQVFAAGLHGPRLMAFSPAGVLHVCDIRAGQVVALPDRNHDGVADEAIVVMDGLVEAHSLAFYQGDFYVSEENRIDRGIDRDGDGIYEDREVFIDNLPWEGWHDTRTLVFDRINHKAYVSVGSPCDLCRMDESGEFNGASSTDHVPYSPERGSVLQFNDDGTGRRIFATGVRNVIGMDFHPVTNELWATNNGHDEEGRTRPPEWIDILRDGDFQGYPFVQSYHVWNDFALDRYAPVMLPITHADTMKAMSQKQPVALVPAHWAPMAIHFYTGDQFPERYRNAAFVAFRAGKAKLSSHPGYKVQALFSNPDGSDAVRADFLSGFQTGTTQESVWGFPVGLMTDDEGSLYVSSDNRTELILKITYSRVGGSWEPDVPSSVIVANPLRVRATVHVERLAEGGAAPRVVADLSALGGPDAVPLIPAGGDAWTLDAPVVPGKVGAFEVVVRIEQQIGDRLETARFTQTVDVVPPQWSHDLPGALVRGQAIDLRAAVHVEPFVADDPVPRVVADLRGVGGPASVPLIARGGDDYTLSAPVSVDVPVGAHDIVIRLEQEVAGVLRSFDFVHTLKVSPPDLAVLDEVLAGDWAFSGSGGATVLGPRDDVPAFSGRVAHAVQAAPPSLFGTWTVDLTPALPVSREGFVGVRFAIDLGDTPAPSIPVLTLVIDGLNLDLVRDPKPGLAVDLSSHEWQVLEVPFTVFDLPNAYGDGLRDQVDAVDRIELQGNLKGTFYLDDVRIVTSIPAAPPAPTVVAESHDDTRPARFALEPNYPNPFNSSTVIRYALSDPANVTLTVYNAAGQAVANLVDGPRPSGRHSVIWDGRADHGEALASGVYLARLTADTWLGVSEATRKVLLLR